MGRRRTATSPGLLVDVTRRGKRNEKENTVKLWEYKN